MKYREKGVIEAFKWTGGFDQDEDPEWIIQAIKDKVICFIPELMFIATTNGDCIARPGDYIIKDSVDVIRTCRAKVFEEKYELVD